MPSTGVETNTLRDGELLPERKLKQRSKVVPKMKFMECDIPAMIAERSVQAFTETGYVEEDRFNPPPQGTETSPCSRKAHNLEEELWFRSM